jgi:hypothetical protein
MKGVNLCSSGDSAWHTTNALEHISCDYDYGYCRSWNADPFAFPDTILIQFSSNFPDELLILYSSVHLDGGTPSIPPSSISLHIHLCCLHHIYSCSHHYMSTDV